MKKNYTTIILLTFFGLSANAQWAITTGPSEPNVVALGANNTVLLAGCSSAGSSLGGYRTLNNGNTWTPTGTSLVSKFSSIAVNSGNGTIYAGGQACFYQSADNGATFTNTNTGLSSYTTDDIVIDGTKLYASAQGIYLSINGGLNWSLISPVISSRRMDVSGSIILVGTTTTGVYLSTNSGSTWATATSGLPTNIADVKIVGTNFLVATASGVYISTNSGSTWTITNLTISTNCIYQIGSTLFAGCNGGVYYSTNGGNTWIASNTGLTNMTVYSLTSNATYIFAGTTGYVFRRPLSDFGLTTSVLNQNNMTADITLAPNPNNGIFTISQNNTTKTEIEIHNIVGELIYTTTTTMSQTTIDLSRQPKGIYFVRTTDTNKSVTNKKIIIQ